MQFYFILSFLVCKCVFLIYAVVPNYITKNVSELSDGPFICARGQLATGNSENIGIAIASTTVLNDHDHACSTLIKLPLQTAQTSKYWSKGLQLYNRKGMVLDRNYVTLTI